MTRYFGVFASRHHLRPRILLPSVVPASGHQLALGLDDDDARSAAAQSPARPRRIGWATDPSESPKPPAPSFPGPDGVLRGSSLAR